MKKQLICASVLLTCLAASAAFAGGPEILVQPDYFSGFFFGPTGAFHMAAFPGSASTSFVDPVTATATFNVISPPGAVVTQSFTQIFFPAGTLASSDISGNAFNGYYGVQGGVGKVFNHRWYIGVVGFGEWGNQSNTHTDASQFIASNVNGNPANTTMATAFYTNSTTVGISNDYGVAFKPGFLVAPKTMFYGKIGASWADLTVTNSVYATSQQIGSVPGTTVPYNALGVVSGGSSHEERKMGLLLGIGGEQFIYRDFITINVEYNYVNYGNVSTTTPVIAEGNVTVGGGGVGPLLPLSAGGGTTQASANAKVSTLLAGLNFYFGSQWF